MLRISNLTIMFGGLAALQGVSFSVGEKQIVGLIGPNGAGKSTLLNALCGIYAPTAGTISFGEHDLTRSSTHKLPSLGIARTFQNLELFPDATVRENILVGCDFRFKSSLLSDLVNGATARRTQHSANAEVDREISELGLLAVADEPVRNLPYGLQKRTELARALIAQPKLLLLDEPAAGANPTESQQLGMLIGQLREQRGMSVLLIEHDMPLVMNTCDHVIVLDHGTKIFEGDPSRVAKEPAVIEAYLGEEFAHAGR
jgi:branched-chain amino acid transport system ATP-binding protein